MDLVKKGWGREIIFASNELYTGKLLEFEKNGKMSLHFHKNKTETWYVLKGQFSLTLLNLENAEKRTKRFDQGESLHIEPFHPHQLECLSDGGVIVEVSTQDDPHDNYRIAPGDSQNADPH